MSGSTYLSTMLRGLFSVLLVFTVGVSMAQFSITPINPVHDDLLRQHQAKSKVIKPTAYAPYILPIQQQDSLFDADTKGWQRRAFEHWIPRKIRNEHLIEVNTPDFVLHGDATFNFEGGRDRNENPSRTLYTNTRGYQFSGTIGQHAFFNTSFYETQSVLPIYMDSVATKRGGFNNEQFAGRGSIPGYGRWKPFNPRDRYYYDYAFATGTFGWAFTENTFVQFGHDKQFVGYGYRSLLLSDASAPYPFLRAQVSFWENRITYTSTWAVLQSLDRVPSDGSGSEASFIRMGAKFNYLHVQPLHWLGIGLFDGTTWTWRQNNNPKSVEYYMPYGWVYSGEGIRNHLVGLNYFASPLPFFTLYGQQVWNVTGEGRATQVGLKFIGLPPNLSLQFEWNNVGDNAYYTPMDTAFQTVLATDLFEPDGEVTNYYQHNDQMLAHPMGVSLNEFLIRMRYRMRDLNFSLAIHQVQQHLVSNPRSIRFVQFEGGYIINPKSNAQLVVGMIRRTEELELSANPLETNYTYIAFRTNLFNRYLDF